MNPVLCQGSNIYCQWLHELLSEYTLPYHQITIHFYTDKIRGIFSFFQTIQENITLDFLDTAISLEQVSIGILDSVIGPAYLRAFGYHSFFTPSFKIFLSHGYMTSFYIFPKTTPKAVLERAVFGELALFLGKQEFRL